MSVLSEKWQKKWELMKKRKVGQKFGCLDLFGMQTNGQAGGTHRDMEMIRLESTVVYNNSENSGESLEPTLPILACKFCPSPQYNTILAAADEDGFLTLHNMNANINLLSSSRVHKNAIFDIAWMPGDSKILTMSGDNTARLWDIREAELTNVATFVGHSKSVKTADFMPTDPATFATGSRDGSIMLWDSRASHKSASSTYKPDQSIPNAAGTVEHKRKGQRYGFANSVTALAFQDKTSLLCSGSTDRFIRIWDMRRTYCSWKLSEPKRILSARKCGFNDLKLSPDRVKLYASCINASILCFNLNSASCEPIAEFTGHDASSFYVRTSVSSDGLYLASGSSDKSVCVWKTGAAELECEPRLPFLRFTGHISEVTGATFSWSGRTTMATCGDDGTIRAWRPSATQSDFTSQDTAVSETKLEDHTSPLNSSNKPFLQNSTRSQRMEDFPSLERSNSESSLDQVSIMLTRFRNIDTGQMPESETENDTSKNELGSSVVLGNYEKATLHRQKTPPRRAVRTEEILLANGKRKFNETSPLKRSPSKRLILSPSKTNGEYRSPTFNLPNYVAEGSGPSHSCPRTRCKENLDWLTKMRRRSTGKTSVSAEKSSKRHRPQSNKRCSRKTLLEYYKKSSKGTDDLTQKT